MSIEFIPQDIRALYSVFEWRFATSILQCDFNTELEEIYRVLRGFQLTRSDILTKGGRKSPIAKRLDSQFYSMGWEEKWFNINTEIDGIHVAIPTHGIDCFKNKIGVEVEWNNKDPFFDRDLNNFRLLFDLNALSVGVIITRNTNLQAIFDELGKGVSYGATTTHWDKLIPKIEGQGSGGCPVLVFGISNSLYRPDL
jgi:hypothetical protein